MKRLKGVAIAFAILLAAVAVGFGVRTWGIGLVRIAGSSMNATLMSGDIVLVTRYDYRNGGTPEFSDVVECCFPGRADVYVKRVVGLPGDQIVFSGGMLYRNGMGVSEPYISSGTEDYAVVLGEDAYLLLGDNRAESYDSRMEDMGPVGLEAFRGRVRLVVWPLNRFGSVD